MCLSLFLSIVPSFCFSLCLFFSLSRSLSLCPSLSLCHTTARPTHIHDTPLVHVLVAPSKATKAVTKQRYMQSQCCALHGNFATWDSKTRSARTCIRKRMRVCTAHSFCAAFTRDVFFNKCAAERSFAYMEYVFRSFMQAYRIPMCSSTFFMTIIDTACRRPLCVRMRCASPMPRCLPSSSSTMRML